MALKLERNHVGRSYLAMNLASIMVHSYCNTDDFDKIRQEEGDLEFTLEPLLETSAMFQAQLLDTAVWILNQRYAGKRTYFIDNDGGIDFHTERVLTEEAQNEAFAEFEAQQQRKTEMESGTFGK